MDDVRGRAENSRSGPRPRPDRRPAPTPTNDDMGCSGSKHETATILQESNVEISSSNVMHEGGERKLSTHAGVSAVLGADEYDTIRVHVVNPSAGFGAQAVRLCPCTSLIRKRFHLGPHSIGVPRS